MTWTPRITPDRRAAIGRAGRAVVRLAPDPTAKESAHQQNAIVNDLGACTDRMAWDAVDELERMVCRLGVVTAEDDREEPVDPVECGGQNGR